MGIATAPDIPLAPQPGPQMAIAASPADIAFIGGSNYGGKTWYLVAEPTKHLKVPFFGSVTFRKVRREITQKGGIWDESKKLYPRLRGMARVGDLKWRFPVEGVEIQFAAIEHDADLESWDSSQICLLQIDQAEQWSEKAFWYLWGRNRSVCGVRPYMRLSCNPDPDSYLRSLLGWWIDEDTGYSIRERSGVLRYFHRQGDELVWAFDPEELIERFSLDRETDYPSSITFIPALPEDNRIGMQLDPSYVPKLKRLPRVEYERRYRGNWKVRAGAGDYFKREHFKIVDAVPAGGVSCRGWDLAATKLKPGQNPHGKSLPSETASTRMTLVNGRVYITDSRAFREESGRVRRAVKNLGDQDGERVLIGLPQDPGQAGKAQIEDYARFLQGLWFHASPESGSKEERARPLSSQAHEGNVYLLRGAWNEDFITAGENFPYGGRDRIDSASRAYMECVRLASVDDNLESVGIPEMVRIGGR